MLAALLSPGTTKIKAKQATKKAAKQAAKQAAQQAAQLKNGREPQTRHGGVHESLSFSKKSWSPFMSR